MSVEVINLSHIYGENTIFEYPALSDISFKIEDRDFIGLIGHTGSGKSTLIQHINRLLKPTSGTILLGDVDINSKDVKMKDIVKKVGIVFQYPEDQLFEETIYKDMAFGPKNLGLSDSETEDRVREACSLVGIDFDKYKDVSPFELSGGQKRRVAIAGVLAMNPEVLILDEPASGLDPLGRKEILDNIYSLYKKKNITIILVSHSMNDIAEYANKILVFSDGKVKMYDTPQKVFNEVELLEGIGLEAPESKYLMLKLKDKGFNVDTNIFSSKDAVSEVVKIIKGKKK